MHIPGVVLSIKCKEQWAMPLLHLWNRGMLLVLTENSSMKTRWQWLRKDIQKAAVFPKWPLSNLSSYAWYFSMRVTVEGSLRAGLRWTRLQDWVTLRRVSELGMAAFSSSMNCSIKSLSNASHTVFRQKRDLAYAFPLKTPFRDPFVTSCASQIISAYPEPLILWPVSIPM